MKRRSAIETSKGSPIRNRWIWSLVVLFAGSGAMIIEISAPRLMQPYFGASTFVWTNVIGVVLLALAMGYRIGGRLADRGADSRAVGLILIAAASLALSEGFCIRPLARWLLPEPASLIVAPAAYGQLRTGSLLAAAIMFAPAVFLLGMVSPVVISVLTREKVPVGSASGDVFMWGTIGSLVGTFLPTYLLVPTLGSRETLVVAAAMLGLPGALLLVRGRGGAALKAGVIGIVASMAAGAYVKISATPIDPPSEGQSLLFETESTYQYVRVVRQPGSDGGFTRFVSVNEGLFESQSMLQEGRTLTGGYYDTMAAFPALLQSPGPVSSLILGSGAGTLSRLLWKLWPGRVQRIVNVELDPAIRDLEPLFGYNPPPGSKNYSSHVMDGRVFLSLTRERFDLVYVDMYARQSDIPYHVATNEFFRELWNAVNPGGIVVMNIHMYRVPRLVIQGLVRGLSQESRQVMSSPSPKGFNLLLWCRNGEGAPNLAEAAGVPEQLAAVMRHMRRFSVPMQVEPGAPRFTDDFAPVEYLERRLPGSAIFR